MRQINCDLEEYIGILNEEINALDKKYEKYNYTNTVDRHISESIADLLKDKIQLKLWLTELKRYREGDNPRRVIGKKFINE